MKYVLVILFSLLLAACGDTVSQSATGSGSNCNSHDGDCSTVEAPEPEPVPEPSEGDDLINGCSVESEAEGKCSRE